MKINKINFNDNKTVSELIDNFCKNNAYADTEIYAEEQQIMEKLSEILEGFAFYENF